MAAIKTGYTYISACRQDGSETLTAISMFSGSSYPMRSTGLLYDQTGSGESNIAISKQEEHISQFVDVIATKVVQRINALLKYTMFYNGTCSKCTIFYIIPHDQAYMMDTWRDTCIKSLLSIQHNVKCSQLICNIMRNCDTLHRPQKLLQRPAFPLNSLDSLTLNT